MSLTAWSGVWQVCPERLDLIHQHYRKLCRMVVDMDEWGQTVLTNILLRYSRTQVPSLHGSWISPLATKKCLKNYSNSQFSLPAVTKPV
jgi:hypothetical protein